MLLFVVPSLGSFLGRRLCSVKRRRKLCPFYSLAPATPVNPPFPTAPRWRPLTIKTASFVSTTAGNIVQMKLDPAHQGEIARLLTASSSFHAYPVRQAVYRTVPPTNSQRKIRTPGRRAGNDTVSRLTLPVAPPLARVYQPTGPPAACPPPLRQQGNLCLGLMYMEDYRSSAQVPPPRAASEWAATRRRASDRSTVLVNIRVRGPV